MTGSRRLASSVLLAISLPIAAQAASPAPSFLTRDAVPPSVAEIASDVEPLRGPRSDVDGLVDRLADRDVVLLGEPSHGSQEVYETRALITRHLIEEAGFSGLVIEGDWPDARRVDRYVRGLGADASAEDALAEFDEFPEWMWANEVFAELVEWLRDRNLGIPYEDRAGVHGMDLYSVRESSAAVVAELAPLDPDAAARVEKHLGCVQDAAPAESDDAGACSAGVRHALDEATVVAGEVPRRDRRQADRAFSAIQNARVVINGRRYELGEGATGETPWNIRDRHMAETLWALRDHLRHTGRGGGLVVWAHDSHIGDARSTEVTRWGQVNLGQLVREEAGIDPFLLGFSTYSGTVRAAEVWGGESQVMEVVPALPGSHADVLHDVALAGTEDFLVSLGPDAPAPLREERLERFIGVIYLPETERSSHYISTRIAEEYDALIHLDETSALEPLASGSATDERA